jgi:hypothetical protein
MKHIKLYEEFVNEATKTIQQKFYDSQIKILTKSKKEWEQELKSTTEKEYAQDRVDTVSRLLTYNTNLKNHADAAAASDLGYEDPKVMQMDLDAAIDFLADREELVKAIETKIKKGEYSNNLVASNLIGSETDLKANLEEFKYSIKSLKTRIADLTKKLG